MFFSRALEKQFTMALFFGPARPARGMACFFFAGRGSARAHSHKESSMDLALPSAGWLPGGMACFFFRAARNKKHAMPQQSPAPAARGHGMIFYSRTREK